MVSLHKGHRANQTQTHLKKRKIEPEVPPDQDILTRTPWANAKIALNEVKKVRFPPLT